MNVEYRLVAGHPGYRIGNDGSFWSRKSTGKGGMLRTQWKRIAPALQHSGYFQVCMYESDVRTYRKIHALVLEAFVGPRPPGMLCRHLDGNPTNNWHWNLRWGTGQENQADSMRHGTRCLGARHPAAKLSPDSVREIRARRAAGEKIAAIGAAFGVTDVMVSKIARREWWKHVA